MRSSCRWCSNLEAGASSSKTPSSVFFSFFSLLPSHTSSSPIGSAGQIDQDAGAGAERSSSDLGPALKRRWRGGRDGGMEEGMEGWKEEEPAAGGEDGEDVLIGLDVEEAR